MGIWLMTWFFTLLIPGTMIFFGFLWKKRPPKNRNCLYGYRTARSGKSQASWDFAHLKIGRIWRIWGMVSLLLSAAVFFLGSLAFARWEPENLGASECVDAFSWLSLGLVAAQLLLLMVSIFPVERALKRLFDENGNPWGPEAGRRKM